MIIGFVAVLAAAAVIAWGIAIAFNLVVGYIALYRYRRSLR